MKQIIINFCLVLIGLVVGIILIEFASWTYLKYSKTNYLLSRWEVWKTKPPPYQNAYYFSSDFLNEAWHSARVKYIDNLFVLEDFEGPNINVKNGKRKTTDQPLNPKHRILMFGGSTLFGQEVPDAETIPSHLQRKLNVALPAMWIVENYGIVAITAEQQYKTLQNIEIQSGDVVIFYDGINDVGYSVFSGYRGGWNPTLPSFRPVHKLSKFHKLMLIVRSNIGRRSSAGKVAFNIYHFGLPNTITDRKILSENLEFAESSYELSLRKAHKLSSNAGVTFVHFLQPHIFSQSRLSSYAQNIISNPYVTPTGLATAFEIGYPKLRNVSLRLAENGILSFDISDIFDNQPEEEEVFLDFAHVNHVANEKIADHMANVLIPLLRSTTNK